MKRTITNITHPLTGLLLCAGMLAGGGCSPKDAAAETADKKTENKTTAPVSVETQTLKAEPYVQRIEASGKALPHKESILSLGVPGLVKEILVKRGDVVKKGDVLIKLDRRGFALGVQQAEAALAGAIAQEELLKIETVRLNNLLAEGAAPSASRDDLNAKRKGAQSQRRMAAVGLAQARKALKDAVLRAPYDGTINKILIDEGEQAPVMPPTMLVGIVDASTLEVQIFVPEEHASFVKTGNTATVTVESASVVTNGEIVYVSDSIAPGARTFEVRIAIDNKDATIKAGAYARVTLAQTAQTEALFVPIAAVQRDSAGKPFVFIANDDTAIRKEIVLGAVQGARVQAAAGLNDGDVLITTNMGSLVDGAPITISE